MEVFLENYLNLEGFLEKYLNLEGFLEKCLNLEDFLEKYLNLEGFLEKYLNLEGFLENSMKIKSAFRKKTGKSLKSLEKSLYSTIFVGLSTVDRDLNQHKLVVPLFNAAYAAPNILNDLRNLTIFTCFKLVNNKL